MRLVSRNDLEASLSLVKAAVADPRAGIFGPESAVWPVNRESLVFLGAGRAALLQLAHPFVAFGVDRHSKTRTDPLGRFQRTFAQVFGMVFGDLERAFRAARGVHAIHTRIRGEIPEAAGRFAGGAHYEANEPEALLWVHATLWDTSLLCWEAIRGPLPDDTKERYYEETKRFARLFGIPDDVLPTRFGDFRAYVDRILGDDTLAVTPCAAEMARFLFRPLLPGTGPLLRWYARFTAGLLPERIARGYGLPPSHPARHERDLRRIRVLLATLPERLRFLPAYVEARRRLEGRTDRDFLGEILSRLLVGSARR
jgi:uncharacterized protein (DUF2236 family)